MLLTEREARALLVMTRGIGWATRERALSAAGSALALPGLAGEEDIETLAASVPPGASAAILVIELLWAKAFAAALYDAGGFVAGRYGVPAPLVNAYLSEHVG